MISSRNIHYEAKPCSTKLMKLWQERRHASSSGSSPSSPNYGARRRSPQAHNGICVSGINALASRPPVLWGPALAIPRRRSSPLPLCGWGWSQTLPGPAGGRKLSHSWKYNARLGVQKPAGGNAKWEDRQCTTENVGSLVTPHGANIIWPNSMYHVWSDLSLDQLLRLIN